jgi:hypothetical protein
MKAVSMLLLIALLFAGFSVNAQISDEVKINPQDPVFRQKYENVDFHGKFSVKVLSDNTNNYFLVDFSKLRDKYEKVYFMSLLFQDRKVVNIDSDLKLDKLWFLSNKMYPVDEINNLLQDIKEQTIKNSNSLTVEQKSKWLLENNKYK